MHRLSRRAIIITAIAATVALAAGVLAAFLIKAEAESGYTEAAAELTSAVQQHNAAGTALDAARTDAVQAVTDTRSLTAEIDPALLADAATVGALQEPLTALIAAAGLTETDGTLIAPSATPAVPAPDVSSAPKNSLEEAEAALRAQTATVIADTATLTAATTAITTAKTDVDAATTALAASAYAYGSATTPRSKASADTVTAYTAAVAALAAPAVDADLTALLVAYRTAWYATLTSDAIARAGTGAEEPTYMRGILVVNKTFAIPSTFGDGLTAETADSFAAMQAAAAEQGLKISISSGFRSFGSQTSIYNRYVANEGVEGADTHSARPGHSEHQSGLAFDLNSITQSFGSTPAGIWTAENAHLYGFVVRYPQGKEEITGYIWEPWHLRYVGVDIATTLYTSGLTIEEYLGVDSVYR
jgi:hypothetical protein